MYFFYELPDREIGGEPRPVRLTLGGGEVDYIFFKDTLLLMKLLVFPRFGDSDRAVVDFVIGVSKLPLFFFFFFLATFSPNSCCLTF